MAPATQNPEVVEITKQQQNAVKSTEKNEAFSIRLFAWNVNGIRSVLKSGELKNFIDKARPQILCLNETKIDQETL